MAGKKGAQTRANRGEIIPRTTDRARPKGFRVRLSHLRQEEERQALIAQGIDLPAPDDGFDDKLIASTMAAAWQTSPSGVKKKHTPTKKSKKLVLDMARAGWSLYDICCRIGLNRETLHNHYTAEVAAGRWDADTQAAGAMLRQAKKGNVLAGQLWLKRPGGLWDKPAKDSDHNPNINIKITLTDEKL